MIGCKSVRARSVRSAAFFPFLPAAATCANILGMVTLAQANVYLRDPVQRRAMLESNARQSSIFEGARLPPRDPRQRRAGSRASIAATKNSTNGS